MNGGRGRGRGMGRVRGRGRGRGQKLIVNPFSVGWNVQSCSNQLDWLSCSSNISLPHIWLGSMIGPYAPNAKQTNQKICDFILMILYRSHMQSSMKQFLFSREVSIYSYDRHFMLAGVCCCQWVEVFPYELPQYFYARSIYSCAGQGWVCLCLLCNTFMLTLHHSHIAHSHLPFHTSHPLPSPHLPHSHTAIHSSGDH